MSLAWGSLVLLLLLLPGVLFFVGLYMPENFTRESTERSAIGQLSAVLGVSAIVHTAFVVANWLLATYSSAGAPWYYAVSFPPVRCCKVPFVDIEQVTRVIVLEASDKDGSVATVATMLGEYFKWILSYLFFSFASGVALGYAFGRWCVPRIPGFAPHPWVLELGQGEDLTVAYVLTHVRHEEKILAYHGFLKTFALKRDGSFAYVVLKDAVRGYMLMSKDAPEVQPLNRWRVIGAAAELVSKRPAYQDGRRLARRYLHVEGEDVANVVFERYEAAELDVTQEQLEATILKVWSELKTESLMAILRHAGEQQSDVPDSIWQLHAQHQIPPNLKDIGGERENE